MLYPSLAFRSSSNLFTGATVAYSLRSLSSGATSVVRVRRSSDNAEQDFSANELTDGTLATFCGANNGFVTTWYDQSGNGNHATQATQADQPKIYDSATGIYLLNGKPAILFATPQKLVKLGVTRQSGASTTGIFVYKSSSSSAGVSQRIGNMFDINGESATFRHGGFIVYGSGLPPVGSSLNSTTYYLSFVFWGHSSATRQVYLNSSLYFEDLTGTLVNAQSPMDVFVSTHYVSEGFSGLMQEFVVYDTDARGNKAEIESNVNAYYGIY